MTKSGALLLAAAFIVLTVVLWIWGSLAGAVEPVEPFAVRLKEPLDATGEWNTSCKWGFQSDFMGFQSDSMEYGYKIPSGKQTELRDITFL